MFDVQAWVDDPLFAFSDEEKAAELARFSTDDRRKALEANQLRQADYSKQMNAGQAKVDAAQKKVDEADAKLNAELAEWSKVQGASVTAQAAADKRADALEHKLLIARQTVERIAQAAAIDPAEYLKDLETGGQPPADPKSPPAGAPATDPPDLSGLAKTVDIATMNKFMFTLQTTLPMLQAEHLALTGEPLDTVALGDEIQRRATAGEPLNPREVWEALHDIPAKRDVAEKKTYDAAIQAAEDRGREAALSEHTLPVGAPAGKHAVIFQPDGEGKPRESKLERPQPDVRTQSAIQALRTHKYLDPTVAPPGASGGQPGAP